MMFWCSSISTSHRETIETKLSPGDASRHSSGGGTKEHGSPTFISFFWPSTELDLGPLQVDDGAAVPEQDPVPDACSGSLVVANRSMVPDIQLVAKAATVSDLQCPQYSGWLTIVPRVRSWLILPPSWEISVHSAACSLGLLWGPAHVSGLHTTTHTVGCF